MGLIDFIRSAGEKVFGTGEAAAAPTTDEAVLAKRATALKEHVRSLALPVEGLKIKVAGDVAYVKGTTASQETRENRIEVTAPAPEARYYTVVKDDTLSAVAKKHCGDANQYSKVFEANKPMLKHPDKIYPGQVLRIP